MTLRDAMRSWKIELVLGESGQVLLVAERPIPERRLTAQFQQPVNGSVDSAVESLLARLEEIF